MFPNVRLMIVAVFASIMGISFALGLFAEFRISHDSVAREANLGASLQFGSDAAPAAVVNTASTFGSRPQAAPLALGITPVIERQTEMAKPDAALVPPPAPAVEPSSPAVTSASAGRDGQQSAKDATGDIAVQTPTTSPPPETAAPRPQIAPEGASVPKPTDDAKSTRPRLARPRLLKRPHTLARREATGHDFISNQSYYQWALQSGLQSPQPVRRRVVIRRAHPATNITGEGTTPQSTAAANSTPNPPAKY